MERGGYIDNPVLPAEQWYTRSRKRRTPFDEGHSVESTDTEDDLASQTTSAVSSPAPSQRFGMSMLMVWVGC